MPPRLWQWGGVLATAGAVLLFAPEPDAEVVAPAVRAAAPAQAQTQATAAPASPVRDRVPEVLALAPRPAPDAEAARLWQPRHPRPVQAPPRGTVPTPDAQARDAALPVAPPVPFRVLGRYADGEQAGVVLMQDGEVVLAHAGESLGGAWRVEAIAGNQMVLRHVPLDLRQTVDISVGGTP